MKKTKHLKLVILLLAIILLGGIGIKVFGPRFGIYLFPPSTKEYVETALRYMGNGIYADGEEWKAAKEKAVDEAKSAKSYEETYDILIEAARVAGGKHSNIFTTEYQEEVIASQLMPETEFEDGIIYIKLPAFDGGSGKADEYISAIIDQVETNQGEIKGAIIDLRDNTGGSMGPMLAAVSPFVPDGPVIYFKNKYSSTEVTLEKGAIIQAGSEICRAKDFDLESIPVAVLQNEWTASSGEVTLLCLKGLPNVKTFGCGSAGYASANMTYWLYDGAELLITVAKDVDRFGNEYCEEPIAPDVDTTTPLEDARTWLLGMNY